MNSPSLCSKRLPIGWMDWMSPSFADLGLGALISPTTSAICAMGEFGSMVIRAIFAPTLFAGAVAGLTFSALANAVAGAGLPVGNFALFGMAGVMAGTIHAPLMAIFLTVEMTASYPYLLPVSIVAAISFGVIRLFNFHSFYSTKI